MEVRISKEIYESDISARTLSVYIIAKFLYTTTYFDKVFVSGSQIAYYLGGVTKTNVTNANKELEIIYNNQLLEMEKIGANKYEISGYTKGKTYASLNIDHIMKILKEPHSSRKYKLLKYYCVLMGCRLNDLRICNYSLEDLANKMGVDIMTINSYNKILEKENIIYIYKNYFSNDANRHNVYGAYEDKKYVDRFAKAKGYNKKNGGNSDWRRSVTLKYNKFVRNPDAFSEDERELLRQNVIRYNEEMDEMQSVWGGNYIMRKKDLSYFEF